MRSDGSRKARITFSQGADVLPVFSPDGNYLMWASKRNGKTTQVWLAHFAMPKGA
jgi:Tol biopolymer transport system component